MYLNREGKFLTTMLVAVLFGVALGLVLRGFGVESVLLSLFVGFVLGAIWFVASQFIYDNTFGEFD